MARGYLYRCKFADGRPKPEKGTVRVRCTHEDHARTETCPGCGSRFGRIWWAKYYVNGRAVRESTETEKETEARRFLKAKEGRVAVGQPIPPRMDHKTSDELGAALRQHYRTTGKRRLTEAEGRLAHLDAFFAGWRAVNITGESLTAYVAKRQGDPTTRGAHPSNRTINIDLALLRRMFRLAVENGTPLPIPPISKKMLKEAPPRKGFFEREQYEAVRRHLAPDLQVAVAIAHTYGWRMRSEVLPLELRQVGLETGTLRLDPGQTKNDEARGLSHARTPQPAQGPGGPRDGPHAGALRGDPVPVPVFEQGAAPERLSESLGDRLPQGRLCRDASA